MRPEPVVAGSGRLMRSAAAGCALRSGECLLLHELHGACSLVRAQMCDVDAARQRCALVVATLECADGFASEVVDDGLAHGCVVGADGVDGCGFSVGVGKGLLRIDVARSYVVNNATFVSDVCDDACIAEYIERVTTAHPRTK